MLGRVSRDRHSEDLRAFKSIGLVPKLLIYAVTTQSCSFPLENFVNEKQERKNDSPPIQISVLYIIKYTPVVPIPWGDKEPLKKIGHTTFVVKFNCLYRFNFFLDPLSRTTCARCVFSPPLPMSRLPTEITLRTHRFVCV